MEGYRHVLAAVDVTEEAVMVARRAKELAERYGARLSLIHVVEPVVADAAYDFLPPVPVELETGLVERGRQLLESLARDLGVPEAQQRVGVGSIKSEIFRAVEELQADLIVLGTHGRHGVALLLGSTASAVLHGTPCDVLAVRIKSEGA